MASSHEDASKRKKAEWTVRLAAFIACSTVIFFTNYSRSETITLDHITVRSQKKDQYINDVPFSVSVIGSYEIESFNIKSLRDIGNYMSNVSIDRSGTFDTIFIRGVGGGGRNIGFTTRAGVYIDGVYVGQFAAINHDSIDLSKIEVLKGPQGQLFGRNTTSGAINISTLAPSQDMSLSVSGGTGRMGLAEISAALNVPIANRAALRIAAVHRQRDGFTKNRMTRNDLDNINRDAVRLRLRLAAGSRLTLDLTGDYSRDHTNRLVGEPVSGTFGMGPADSPGAYDTSFNVDPVEDVELAGGSLQINYELGGGASITSVTAVRSTHWDHFNDLDYSMNDWFSLHFKDRFHQFSQETRIAFGNSRALNGLFGIYYLNESATSDRQTTSGREISALPFGLLAGPAAGVNARVRTTSLAAFGSTEWRIADGWTLNLGARLTRERLSLVDYSAFGPAIFGLATITDFQQVQTSTRFDPSAAVTVALSDAANLYFRYARGSKAGGWNVDFVSPDQFSDGIDFQDETVDAFEVGIKASLAERRVRVALSAFKNLTSDYQINQFVDLGQGQSSIQLRNAAKVVSKGIEGNATWLITSGLTLSGEAAYTGASFLRFPNGGGPGINLDGHSLPYAPRWSMTGSARLRTPAPALKGAMETGLTWSYRSSHFSGPENLSRQFIRGQTNINLHAKFLHDHNWSVSVWCANVLNSKSVDNRVFEFFQTQLVERREPRTFGVLAKWSI